VITDVQQSQGNQRRKVGLNSGTRGAHYLRSGWGENPMSAQQDVGNGTQRESQGTGDAEGGKEVRCIFHRATVPVMDC
jgi:hypothetical protein